MLSLICCLARNSEVQYAPSNWTNLHAWTSIKMCHEGKKGNCTKQVYKIYVYFNLDAITLSTHEKTNELNDYLAMIVRMNSLVRLKRVLKDKTTEFRNEYVFQFITSRYLIYKKNLRITTSVQKGEVYWQECIQNLFRSIWKC